MTETEKLDHTASELADLTPVELRDLVVRYFSAAQGDAFDRAMREMGIFVSEEYQGEALEDMLRLAFRGIGGSFEDPTPESLDLVLHSLTQRCRMTGTPGHILVFNKAGMLKAICSPKKKH